MPDVSAETEKTRAEVAEYLREFADKLSPQGDRPAGDRQDRSTTTDDRPRHDQPGNAHPVDESSAAGSAGTDGSRTADRSSSGKVTVIAGNESATINPPESLLFGVEVDAEDSLLGGPTGQRGVTFSLTWSSEDVETDEEFDVE